MANDLLHIYVQPTSVKTKPHTVANSFIVTMVHCRCEVYILVQKRWKAKIVKLGRLTVVVVMN